MRLFTVTLAATLLLVGAPAQAVIDHVGVAGQDNKKLHGMQAQQARDAIMKAGFTIEAESKLLANSADDHTKSVIDPAVRGHTDQFMIRARKTR